jgi:hypothetical protein
MVNIMDGTTQLSVDGKVIVGELATVVLELETEGLVELDAGGLGFNVGALAARSFHVAVT